MEKEYICMVESPTETQKKIRQWMSTGYEIEFINQTVLDINTVVTSLYRIK